MIAHHPIDHEALTWMLINTAFSLLNWYMAQVTKNKRWRVIHYTAGALSGILAGTILWQWAMFGMK